MISEDWADSVILLPFGQPSQKPALMLSLMEPEMDHGALRQWIYDWTFQMDSPEPLLDDGLQVVIGSLKSGWLPSLESLLDTLPTSMEPEVLCRSLARYAYFLNQVGPAGRQRYQQLSLAVALRQKEGFFNQAAYAELHHRLSQLLVADPTQGRNFSLSSPGWWCAIKRSLRAMFQRSFKRGFLRQFNV